MEPAAIARALINDPAVVGAGPTHRAFSTLTVAQILQLFSPPALPVAQNRDFGEPRSGSGKLRRPGPPDAGRPAAVMNPGCFASP